MQPEIYRLNQPQKPKILSRSDSSLIRRGGLHPGKMGGGGRGAFIPRLQGSSLAADRDAAPYCRGAIPGEAQDADHSRPRPISRFAVPSSALPGRSACRPIPRHIIRVRLRSLLLVGRKDRDRAHRRRCSRDGGLSTRCTVPTATSNSSANCRTVSPAAHRCATRWSRLDCL